MKKLLITVVLIAGLLIISCGKSQPLPRDELDYADKFLLKIQKCKTDNFIFDDYNGAYNYVTGSDTNDYSLVFVNPENEEEVRITLKANDLEFYGNSGDMVVRLLRVYGKPNLFDGIECRKIHKFINIRSEYKSKLIRKPTPD